ncbi:MAG: PQQ-like beta-propeller repeat protein, partial [Planctomycetota bacterium]
MKSQRIAKQFILRLLVFTLITTVFYSTAEAADWPNWRGPNYDGISTETGWNPMLPKEVLWKISIGTGFSSMSVVNGRVYAMGNIKDNDIVYCLDAKTGKEIWRHTYSSPLDSKNYEGGPNATPTIDQGRVYTLSKRGMAFCLDIENGRVIWSRDFKKEYGIKWPRWGLSGSALIVDDLVIYNAGTAGIALNKKDGSMVWQNGSDEAGYATPMPFTMNGTKYLAIFTAKSLNTLLTATGEIKWEFPWKTSYNVNAADPIVTGDKVFISSGYNRGSALLKITSDSVTEVWQNKKKAMRNQCNSSVLLNGYLYGFDGQVGGKGKLTCFELETGQVKWAQDGMGTGSVISADGKLIILSEKGKLVIAEVSPEAFKEISSAQILTGKCWTAPVLADGMIYARNNPVGDLVCVDVSGGGKTASVNNSWPQFRGPNRDGKSPETGLLKKWPEGGPKMLWSVEDKLGLGFSSITVVDGLIYTVGMVDNQGILFAFDLDGNPKWEKNYGPEWKGARKGTRTTPTYDNGKLYVISGYAKVVCFDAKTGDIIWEVDGTEKFGVKKTKWGISENALIVDDKIICTPGGAKATMVALNKNNGETVWMTSDFTDNSSYSSPILVERAGKQIIITQTDNYVVAVDAANGKLLFKDSFDDIFGKHMKINPPIPVYYNGSVYITSGYNDGGVMYEISDDGTKFTRKWVDKTLDNHHGGVIVLDGYIYGSNWLSNSKGNWVSLELDTGKVMYEAKWQNKGPILYAEGMLYCYDEKDGVLGLVRATPEKFDVVSSFTITKGDGMHWAYPVICDGQL